MIRELEKLQQALSLFSATLSTQFAPMCRQLSLATIAFGFAWQGLAELVYLQHHRRLPGSLQTCRLRKKRRSKVLVWFERYLEKEGVALTDQGAA